MDVNLGVDFDDSSASLNENLKPSVSLILFLIYLHHWNSGIIIYLNNQKS